MKESELKAEPPISSSPISPLYAGSVAIGSDASVTGLPSPPVQVRPSPSKQLGAIPGARPPQALCASPTPRPGGNNSKTYSFVSLPGNAVKKRPRRRYDEIERLYQCKCVPSPVSRFPSLAVCSPCHSCFRTYHSASRRIASPFPRFILPHMFGIALRSVI